MLRGSCVNMTHSHSRVSRNTTKINYFVGRGGGGKAYIVGSGALL